MPSSPEALDFTALIDPAESAASLASTASVASAVASISAIPAATPRSWEPPDLSAGNVRAMSSAAPARPRPASQPFEVSTSVGIPEAVLAPARAAAVNEGYVAGWNRGHLAGLADAAAEAERARSLADQVLATKVAELERAAEALRNAARALEAREATAAADVEGLILDGAFRIAESLVGVTLADDDLRGKAALARALSLAPTGARVTVAVSPADADTVQRALARHTNVDMNVDATLTPGDAYARFGVSTADARVSVGLERVRAVLAPQDAS